MMLRILVVVPLITGVFTQCDPGDNWKHNNGHCYYVSSSNDFQNHTEAIRECTALDSYIMSVTSMKEADYARDNLFNCPMEGDCNLFEPTDLFWIGLVKPIMKSQVELIRRRSGWKWESGEVYSWMNWYPEEPGPRPGVGYVVMYHTGQWARKEQNTRVRYICEKDAMGLPTTSSSFQPSTTEENKSAVETTVESTNDPKQAVGSGSNTNIIIITVTVSLVVLLVILSIIICVYLRERNRSKEIRQRQRDPSYDNHIDTAHTQGASPSRERENPYLNPVSTNAHHPYVNHYEIMENGPHTPAVKSHYEEIPADRNEPDRRGNIYQEIAPYSNTQRS